MADINNNGPTLMNIICNKTFFTDHLFKIKDDEEKLKFLKKVNEQQEYIQG